MVEIDKVIKVLQDALTAKENYPWARAEMSFEFIEMLLELLKEQEAVEPTWSRGKPFCGACGLRIHDGKFCSECGKPILWKGR